MDYFIQPTKKTIICYLHYRNQHPKLLFSQNVTDVNLDISKTSQIKSHFGIKNYIPGCCSRRRSFGGFSTTQLRDVIGVTWCDAVGHVTQLRLWSLPGQVLTTRNAKVSITIYND